MDDAGWPCQRVRLAIGCLLFFLFEVTIGQKLPPPITLLILGLGLVSGWSAFDAIKSYKQRLQLDVIRRAFNDRLSST
jgi:hypothetical protein